MKKLIVIIMLLLITGFAQAQNWLEVEYAFQFGWIPMGSIQMYTPYSVDLLAGFNSVFSIDSIIFNLIKIGGKNITDFSFFQGYSPLNFWPTGMTYSMYIGIEPIKGISIIYEHGCSHPVAAYAPQHGGEAKLDIGYDRICFEIKGKIVF